MDGAVESKTVKRSDSNDLKPVMVPILDFGVRGLCPPTAGVGRFSKRTNSIDRSGLLKRAAVLKSVGKPSAL
jgi:hypothetical protein